MNWRIPYALGFGLAAIFGAFVGETYIDRLSDRRGFDLVSVEDRVEPRPSHPSHTALILIDGLRADFAEKSAFMRRIAARARCFHTDVGLPSVSAPVYAVVSTGLEQDRTGVRNNDDHAAVKAESIWDVAAAAGLRVEGRSDLSWWKEMFPAGFTAYRTAAAEEEVLDLGSAEALPDLLLLHPTYVDEAGHDHGARSSEYGAAAGRADRGINAVLDRLDLDRDLAIITADHGHAARGGHGGDQREIEIVLTCYVGRGIAPSRTVADMDARTIAPSLAVLLGLRFPKNMRASEDDLDTIFSITSTSAFSPEYLASRMAAVARFRDENRRAVGAWLGRPSGEWPAWYARGRSLEMLRGALVLALFLLVLLAMLARRREGRISSLVFLAAAWALAILFHQWKLDVFDYTAINARGPYIRAEVMVCAAAIALAAAVHLFFSRSLGRLARDLGTVSLSGVAIAAAHIAAYGWPLGSPLPGAVLLFLPFFVSIFLVTASLAGLIASGAFFFRSEWA